jgi:hypothetical protein
MMHRMARPRIAITKRRCSIIVMMLLVAGAIVNVAVAWLAPLRWQEYESYGS